jgi:hypothetical protein
MCLPLLVVGRNCFRGIVIFLQGFINLLEEMTEGSALRVRRR